LGFALPVTVALGLITTACVTLNYYLRGARLYIFGGGLIAMGLWTVLIEFLIWETFAVRAKEAHFSHQASYEEIAENEV